MNEPSNATTRELAEIELARMEKAATLESQRMTKANHCEKNRIRAELWKAVYLFDVQRTESHEDAKKSADAAADAFTAKNGG